MPFFPGPQQSRQFDGNPKKYLGNSFSGVYTSHLPTDQSLAQERSSMPDLGW